MRGNWLLSIGRHVAVQTIFLTWIFVVGSIIHALDTYQQISNMAFPGQPPFRPMFTFGGTLLLSCLAVIIFAAVVHALMTAVVCVIDMRRDQLLNN